MKYVHGGLQVGAIFNLQFKQFIPILVAHPAQPMDHQITTKTIKARKNLKFRQYMTKVAINNSTIVINRVIPDKLKNWYYLYSTLSCNLRPAMPAFPQAK